jgi:hypothetical protein
MEAAVAKKEAGMTEWNDGRLDELSRRMDEGFARADQKMDEGFARADQKMDEGFARVDAEIRHLAGRFDALHLTLVRISLTVAVGLLSIFAALVVNHL